MSRHRARPAPLTDEVVCLEASAALAAVDEWYERFEQTSDENVRPAASEHAVLAV